MTSDEGGSVGPAVDPSENAVDDRARDPALDPAGDERRSGRPRERERRRIAEIFGDVLPESTLDDQDDAGNEGRRGSAARDAEIVRNVPPHHT